MYKCIGLAKRKAGLSREQFIEYYETRHAPLIRRVSPELRGYQRNYIDAESAPGYPLDFDAVIELWFDDRASFDVFVARCAEPEIAEDANNFFDMSAMRVFIVEERSDTLG